MRVLNAKGVKRDILCDIKTCDTQEDVLAQYRPGGTLWSSWVLDGKRYEVCPRHGYTRHNRPSLEDMRPHPLDEKRRQR